MLQKYVLLKYVMQICKEERKKYFEINKKGSVQLLVLLVFVLKNKESVTAVITAI